MRKSNYTYKEFEAHCRKVREMTITDKSETPVEKKQRISWLLKPGNENAWVQYYFPHYTVDKEERQVDCAEFQTDWMKAVVKDPCFFGVAEWPREHSKSVINCVFLPLKLLALRQLDGMLLGSQTEKAACRLLADLQAELTNNDKYISDYGEQFRNGTWEKGEFSTKDNIFFIAVGRGQSPRGLRKGGKRPNLGVIDDVDDDELCQNPNRVDECVKWIRGAFMGALDIRQSRFITCGNRIHPQSVLAHMVGDIDENTAVNEAVYHSKIFASIDGTLEGEPLWDAKFTKAQLKRKFTQMGYYMALREFFHKAIIVGKIFKNEWIQWDKIPPLSEMDWIVSYFDPSYKDKTTNDFKAVRIWGKKGIKLYLIKSFVRQCSIGAAVKFQFDFFESLKENESCEFMMEEVFLQDQFYDDYEAEAQQRGYYLPITGDTRVKPDKYVRIVQTAGYYERGIVIYNIAEKNSPDMKTGLAQLLAFEKGSGVHDDAPDCDEGAIYKLERRGRVINTKPVIGMREPKYNSW